MVLANSSDLLFALSNCCCVSRLAKWSREVFALATLLLATAHIFLILASVRASTSCLKSDWEAGMATGTFFEYLLNHFIVEKLRNVHKLSRGLSYN